MTAIRSSTRDRDHRRPAGPQLGHDRRVHRARDPASDSACGPAGGRCHDRLLGRSGRRAIPAREFFLDTFTTAIEPTEVLTEIRIPRRPRGAGGAYQKLERKVGDFATVGVAAIVRLDRDGEIASAGIGVTGVADAPFAATDAEAVLAGHPPSDDLFRQAGAAAGAQSRPFGDVRGPVDYKRAMTAEMTLRALRTALERALANSQETER